MKLFDGFLIYSDHKQVQWRPSDDLPQTESTFLLSAYGRYPLKIVAPVIAPVQRKERMFEKVEPFCCLRLVWCPLRFNKIEILDTDVVRCHPCRSVCERESFEWFPIE
jgi:hypothetical protein